MLRISEQQHCTCDTSSSPLIHRWALTRTYIDCTEQHYTNLSTTGHFFYTNSHAKSWDASALACKGNTTLFNKVQQFAFLPDDQGSLAPSPRQCFFCTVLAVLTGAKCSFRPVLICFPETTEDEQFSYDRWQCASPKFLWVFSNFSFIRTLVHADNIESMEVFLCLPHERMVSPRLKSEKKISEAPKIKLCVSVWPSSVIMQQSAGESKFISGKLHYHSDK